MTKNEFAALEQHFEYHHNNPPKPFNKDFNPNAAKISNAVVASMEKDNFYETHTREQCSIEYRKRYDEFSKQFSNPTN